MSGGKMAFPGFNYVSSNIHDGMSLREYFAAAALQGLLASGWCEDERVVADSWATIARDAFKAADAMLAASGRAPD